jgi:hypothetical protein
MRKYLVAPIIILTFACAPKTAPVLNTVTYNAIIAETALLNIQTITMDLDKAGTINKTDATRIMNNIRKTNETMKLVSQALTTWNQYKDNGSTLKTILPILKENMAELKKILPANMQAMAAVIEIFVNFDGWYGPVKEAF